MKNLVLLHGFCETKEMWGYFEEELSKKYNVYCLDLPGFGDFHFDITDLSIAEIAQVVHNEINKLQLDEYVLIGHSLGGYVALEIAKQFPQKIKKLGLFHSTVFEDSNERKMKRNDVINFIEKHGSVKFVKSFIPQLFISSKREECKKDIQSLIEKGSQIDQKTLVEITKAMQSRDDNSTFVQQTEIPILFIVCKQHQSVSLADSLAQVHLPKNSTIHILDDCGHMGMFEQKDETIRFVKKFIHSI